jgi:hypothetical protein
MVNSLSDPKRSGLEKDSLPRNSSQTRQKEEKRNVTMEKEWQNTCQISLNAWKMLSKKAGIVGQSEHTITLIGTDANEEHLEYLHLPIRIRGLGEEPREKVIFQ